MTRRTPSSGGSLCHLGANPSIAQIARLPLRWQAKFVQFRRVISITFVPFIIALTTVAIGWLVLGSTLGLFFWGIALSAILVPLLTSLHQNTVEALVRGGAIVDGVGIVWLLTLFVSPINFGQWLAAYLVLAAFSFAVLSIARVAARIRIPAGVITILAIAWLTWPIWLSTHLNATLVRILVPAHPLLALNRIFLDQGIWTQQRLMYQLTTLGQDVPYSLPTSILACVFAHAIIGLALLPLAQWKASATSTEPSTHPSPAA